MNAFSEENANIGPHSLELCENVTTGIRLFCGTVYNADLWIRVSTGSFAKEAGPSLGSAMLLHWSVTVTQKVMDEFS